MKVVDVGPKDIYVLIEISLKELRKLRKGMEMSQVNYDGGDEVEVEAKQYFSEFYEFLNKTIESIPT
jgi:hypothetical protein